MNVLITGGAGFIGSNLVKGCLKQGWTVDVVDDFSNGHGEFIRGLGVNRVLHDCFSSPKVLHCINMQMYDVVFHLAAIPRVSYSVEHPIKTNDINVTRTLELMDTCRGNVRRFVFASSSSVYGAAETLPVVESSHKNPESPYALQKLIIEDYLRLYHKLYGLESISLRFFNVFGDNALGCSPYATALAAWLTAIKSGKNMRSDGDGTQSRDLCHVDNVVDACIRAAITKSQVRSDVYNVASGESVTNKELLEYLLDRYKGSNFYCSPWRAGDVMHTLASVENIKQALGYTPLVKIWEGVEKTCDWYDNNWDWASKLKLKV